MMGSMDLRGAVVFAILMEEGEGILSRSPSYVLEKLRLCEGKEGRWSLLDEGHRDKLRSYMGRWPSREWPKE